MARQFFSSAYLAKTAWLHASAFMLPLFLCGLDTHAQVPTPVVAEAETPSGPLRFTESAKDASAGGLECFKIETSLATYYLEKSGGGLSSIVDPSGNDWLGFHPRAGSGSAGEYRGFPNAVFRESGSYFHPRNENTDPCVCTVVSNSPEAVVIDVASESSHWAGRYTFTAQCCIFTMTRMPKENRYWILYEGTPGGACDDSDWWISSSHPTRNRLTEKQETDLLAPEWIAFGDSSSNETLVLSHVEDDHAADRFYLMNGEMTVFGFGRDGMQKLLTQVPQSFCIGLVNEDSHEAITNVVNEWHSTAAVNLAQNTTSRLDRTKEREQQLQAYALTHRGDATAGKKLFDAKATQCANCHKVADQGGEVGPNLTSIGNKFDRPHLIDSLLYPSQQIGYGYETIQLLTEDSKLLSGVVKSETTGSIVIADINGQLQRVPKSQVIERKVSPVSIMPKGIADKLSPIEFCDLIAYLESLGTKGGKFGAAVSGPIQLPDGFSVSTVATGLSGATAMECAGELLFVCEQSGKLRVIQNGRLLDTPFLEIPVEMNWERGLIGVATAPDFPANPYVYVVYVVDQPHTHHRISRFTADAKANYLRAVPDSEQILLEGDDQSKFGGNVPAGHQGGGIVVGNDGLLYIGLGEQTAKIPAQDMNALQGKILRITQDGSIPEDNPFLADATGKYKSIWALGCRNPFSLAVRRSTGQILINDVGGNYEEINVAARGANYGWPTVNHGPSHRDPFVSPIHIYPESSIAGGDFSDHCDSWPKPFQDKYFFIDFVHGWIRYINADLVADAIAKGTLIDAQDFASGFRRPISLRIAPDGSCYVLLRNAWVVDDKYEPGTSSLLKISYTDVP